MTASDHLQFNGAQVLREGALVQSSVGVANGECSDRANAGVVIDATGYFILPGIIDLHGDAFEHHLAPRPTAPFPVALGLAGTDRDAAANGVTTAWMAQSWSWEGGHRGPDYAESFLGGVHANKSEFLTDLRVQIRCETHTVDTGDRLIAALRKYNVDYVIFNNHLDEALELAEHDPTYFTGWAAKAGRTTEEHMALVQTGIAQSKDVPRYLCRLAKEFDALGIRYGSHDDGSAEVRERFSMIGAKICEFPTSFGAASAAQAWSDPVLMGAPNVVRGGSQSGNIAASDLIAAGLCTALVSDYHYPTLHQAAFRLADEGMSFSAVWALISTNPAQVMGLRDRGEIAEGKRADLTVIHADTRRIEGTLVAGRWSHLSGELASRVMQAGARMRVAAE